MRRPRIGVQPRLERRDDAWEVRLDSRYLEAVRRAGGDPVVLAIPSSADGVDGILMTGGNDINPRRWGERRHPKTDVLDPRKEAADFALIAEADRRDLPLLAICLGSQEVNVARGGTLIQHLGDESGVNAAHRSGRGTHEVTMGDESALREILGRRVKTNSSHHQAIRDVGTGLRVAARADDGVIEALEDPRKRFWLAVQWHPERMGDRPAQRRLFAALVAAARYSSLARRVSE